MKENLTPKLIDVQQEYVLIQAWKKTASYLRSQSWLVDTLEIDYHSLRIPNFIQDIQNLLTNSDNWQSDPLKIVPAPKSQQWEYRNDQWNPKMTENIDNLKKNDIEKKWRPLARVSLKDQVVATTVLMCLADRVEDALGDSSLSFKEAGNRRKVRAYGNRLYCGAENGWLRHRWGSTTLYRRYFSDYQAFLERPIFVADLLSKQIGKNFQIAIVSCDLSNFYDRIRPNTLHNKILKFERNKSERNFFNFTNQLFNWTWEEEDKLIVKQFERLHDIEGFSNAVALPQGLAASGFFANIVLLDFDNALREAFDTYIDESEQLFLEDACFYVDDIRLVVRTRKDLGKEDIETIACKWINQQLESTGTHLFVKKEKTSVTLVGNDQNYLVPQSTVARRIQSEVSGTFDALHGMELLTAIEGFFHCQKKYSSSVENPTGLLFGISDMKDETAIRFAAYRYRKTFRSLHSQVNYDTSSSSQSTSLVLSASQVDERAQLFAKTLIDEWVSNPSQISLVRIAFDMYPSEDYLAKVLEILNFDEQSNIISQAKQKVLTYCLAEIFRAGATETAIVSNEDYIPKDVNPNAYRKKLDNEALNLLKKYTNSPSNIRNSQFPWYLMQQVYLYLIARGKFPKYALVENQMRIQTPLSLYEEFASFVSSQAPVEPKRHAIFLIMAHSGFQYNDITLLLHSKDITENLLQEVNKISPRIALQLWNQKKLEGASIRTLNSMRQLGLEPQNSNQRELVGELVRLDHNPFHSEVNLLTFAKWLLKKENLNNLLSTSPWRICCKFKKTTNSDFGQVSGFSFVNMNDIGIEFFTVPDWCETQDEKIKHKLGLLLRFAIRGSTAFDGPRTDCSPKITSEGYKRSVSHWELQRYSSFQGRSEFGEAWIPLSSFVENLLYELLRWPGSGKLGSIIGVAKIRKQIKRRLSKLYRRKGDCSEVLFLEQVVNFPNLQSNSLTDRPLRVGIVQSIIPSINDFLDNEHDLELQKNSKFRTKHRNHIATLLQGVRQMLLVHQSYKGEENVEAGLDLLVFPELSIHFDDVEPYLIPFIRKFKCIVLCGLVYHKLYDSPNSPLVNSCLWIVPEWNENSGFQIRLIEQGKKHLSSMERSGNVVGFRPAQWLVKCNWNSDSEHTRPIVISSSVCFDATDLSLVADLRTESDLYIVCALNKDVGTFDRMSEMLHYHMFQGVMIVNNGQYGGSSFFVPFKNHFERQVFHLHGQPQATITFAEVKVEELLNRPNKVQIYKQIAKFKDPPAGWKSRNGK